MHQFEHIKHKQLVVPKEKSHRLSGKVQIQQKKPKLYLNNKKKNSNLFWQIISVSCSDSFLWQWAVYLFESATRMKKFLLKQLTGHNIKSLTDRLST